MSIASIMVSLDLGRSAAARVRLAGDLAGRFEAGLVGLAARTVETPAPVGDILAVPDSDAEDRAALADELARVRAIVARSAGRLCARNGGRPRPMRRRSWSGRRGGRTSWWSGATRMATARMHSARRPVPC